MKLIYESWDINKNSFDGIVLLCKENYKKESFKSIDGLTANAFGAYAKKQKFIGKAGSALNWQGAVGETKSCEIILAGVGNSPSSVDYENAAAKAIGIASNKKLKKVLVCIDEYEQAGFSHVLLGLLLSQYSFTKYKKVPGALHKFSSVKIMVLKNALSILKMKKQVKEMVGVAQAIFMCRDLVNEPANVLGVDEMVSVAKSVARKNDLTVKVISSAGLKKEKLNLISAVGGAATKQPALVHLMYSPNVKAKKRIALVGKGVVFDSGGLSLKPASSMTTMKTDMAGAATVIAIMSLLSSLKVKLRVDAYIPLAENSIGKGAVRPGDVVKSHNGLSVEVTNTDAEGRLILADALSYCQKNSPDEIIDFATLTGACSVALGQKRAAVFSNSDDFVLKWMQSAAKTGELFWHLPLADEVKKELKSDVADLKNSGGRFGGSISAALFLEKFVADKKWIHFDIAGPARNHAKTITCPKGGTGFGILTTIDYLKNI